MSPELLSFCLLLCSNWKRFLPLREFFKNQRRTKTGFLPLWIFPASTMNVNYRHVVLSFFISYLVVTRALVICRLFSWKVASWEISLLYKVLKLSEFEGTTWWEARNRLCTSHEFYGWIMFERDLRFTAGAGRRLKKILELHRVWDILDISSPALH